MLVVDLFGMGSGFGWGCVRESIDLDDLELLAF